MVNSNGSCHRLTPLCSEKIARTALADVKNIAGNQAILTHDKNYANIAKSIKIYVKKITTDAPWLTTASRDR